MADGLSRARAVADDNSLDPLAGAVWLNPEKEPVVLEMLPKAGLPHLRRSQRLLWSPAARLHHFLCLIPSKIIDGPQRN